MDLISIIIPVYKVEKYLDRCLTSITKQSYFNIEIILVDDNSPDNSPKICDVWAQKDSRIHVIHKINRGGVSEARNVGIEYAHGEWIMFADSDDWVSPYFCEHAIRCAKEASCDLVCFGSVETNEFYIEDVNANGAWEILEKSLAMYRLINGQIRDYVWNKLYHVSLFNTIKYPIGRVVFEDKETTYLLFDKASKIVVMNEKLYYYFQNNESVMHTFNPKKLIDLFEVRMEQYNFLFDKYLTVVEELKNFLLCDALAVCIHVNPNGEYYDVVKRANKTIVLFKDYKNKLDVKHRILLWFYLKCKPIFYLVCKRKYKL